jgi:gas vesicle protein
MTSPAEEVEEIREKTVREQIDLYRQLREQLIHEVEKYRSEGNDRLASIISESLKE